MKEKVWFIGDSHFFHKNIIRYSSRPFETVEEMNEKLIYNWNNVVKKNDKVIMTGDFALSSRDRIIEVGRLLNGRKTLIKGNHDGGSLKTYYEAGFEVVSKNPILLDNLFIVSHEPVEETGIFYNIHAHTHDKRENDLFHFSTSVEMIQYQPIELAEIQKYFFGEE